MNYFYAFSFTNYKQKHSSKKVVHFTFKLLLVLFFLNSFFLKAQIKAYSTAFNYMTRDWYDESSYGAGYSFYSAAFPMLNKYPGGRNFQSGLVGTWMSAQRTPEDPKYYINIEGGLGWWRDTRFATETPKFIMGAVSHDFFAFANGVGAGKTVKLSNGHRDWSTPGGKYGAAQLSNKLLWPPDGLNLKQGTNGEFLGYGYIPLPLTEPMTTTGGKDIETGNNSWTVFFNTTNFKGPATFILPTFWTEPTLENPDLKGLFLDVRKSRSGGFAIEHQTSPALMGKANNGRTYARDAKRRYPISGTNRSEIAKDILMYSKDAMWNAVEAWFDGGPVANTNLSSVGERPIFFRANQYDVEKKIRDYQYGNGGKPEENQNVDCNKYVKKFVANNQRSAGFEWDLNYVKKEADNFISPEFFILEENNHPNNKWIPIAKSEVPSSSGLLDEEPLIEPRNDHIPYLTPLEEDCHWQDPNGPWESPGPVAGPFYVNLGDGSTLTYYWYRFVDQPSIIHANLPQNQRQFLQERIEKIHKNWKHTDNYLNPPTTPTTLASLDSALLVDPPVGLEIGYVPIVTRQEKTKDILSISSIEVGGNFGIYPNPTNGPLTIETTNDFIKNIKLIDIQGKVFQNWQGVNQTKMDIEINVVKGVYILKVLGVSGNSSTYKIIKAD